jgi:hypothetical protein
MGGIVRFDQIRPKVHRPGRTRIDPYPAYPLYVIQRKHAHVGLLIDLSLVQPVKFLGTDYPHRKLFHRQCRGVCFLRLRQAAPLPRFVRRLPGKSASL